MDANSSSDDVGLHASVRLLLATAAALLTGLDILKPFAEQAFTELARFFKLMRIRSGSGSDPILSGSKIHDEKWLW
jgi:hypothetical protein